MLLSPSSRLELVEGIIGIKTDPVPAGADAAGILCLLSSVHTHKLWNLAIHLFHIQKKCSKTVTSCTNNTLFSLPPLFSLFLKIYIPPHTHFCSIALTLHLSHVCCVVPWDIIKEARLKISWDFIRDILVY